MKRLYTLLFAVVVLFSLLSCAEDRTYEYLDKTQENQWTYSKMKEVYFWADVIKMPERRNFFDNTLRFFNSLLIKSDKVSFFTDSVSNGSYGMKFALMRDPLGEIMSRYYALVLFVETGSPADIAGIERGTWISALDGKALTLSSSKQLQYGTATTVATSIIDYDDENEKYFWVGSDTLSMQASYTFENEAIYLDTIYNVRSNKVGYVVLRNMNGNSFLEQANEVMHGFAAAEVSDVVVDLRYCDNGTMNNTAMFASAFVPSTLAATPFATLKGSEENGDTIYNYTESLVNLSDKRLFFIIGNDTKGVAELLVESVNASREMYDVMIIGENSAGANMLTKEYTSPYGYSINPVVALICASDGVELSAMGITPDYLVDELEDVKLVYPLGNQQEFVLRNLEYLIVNGSLPQ